MISAGDLTNLNFFLNVFIEKLYMTVNKCSIYLLCTPGIDHWDLMISKSDSESEVLVGASAQTSPIIKKKVLNLGQIVKRPTVI